MDPRGLQTLTTLRRAAENEARRGAVRARNELTQAERRVTSAAERVATCRRRLTSAEAEGRKLNDRGGAAGRQALVARLVAAARAELDQAVAVKTAAEAERSGAQRAVEQARAALEDALHAREGAEAAQARSRTDDARGRARREQNAVDDTRLGRRK